MAFVKPFCAVRASRDKVALISSRSYQAYSPAELEAQLDFNPFSFLHIINPTPRERQVDRQNDISSERRFQLVREKYSRFKQLKYYTKDTKPAFYIYKKITKNYTFIGIIAATDTQDYANNLIKKHENTLLKRELLFEKYLKTTGFNAEPVLLTFPDNEKIEAILNKYQQSRAEYEFTTENFMTHNLWLVNDEKDILKIKEEFDTMNAIYIADGHHRISSSYLLKENLKRENPNHNGSEAYNYFMSYLIPESNLKILEFNRLVKDLNGLNKQQLLEKLAVWYDIQNKGSVLYKPSKKHHYSMYLDGQFYSLYLKKEVYEIDNPLSDLDPQLLYDTVLKPILGITDLRNDKRLSYSHSEKGIDHMKNMVDSGQYKVAFGLYPISLEQMKIVADAGLTMPPKSTYILPKLRSGLTIYEF